MNNFGETDLTPVEEYNGILFKRDDLYRPFSDFGVSGGKVRQCIALIKANLDLINGEYNSTIATVASVHSPQTVIVARVAKAFGLHCVIGIGKNVKETHTAIRMCRDLGADIVRLDTSFNYDAVLTGKLEELAKTRPMYIIKFGLKAGTDPQAILETNANQVQNIPKDITHLIIPAGSGLSAAGILLGVKKYLPHLIGDDSVFGYTRPGVVIIQPFGYDRTKLIKELSGLISPTNYEYQYPKYTYNKAYDHEISPGFKLDEIYEAKSYEYFKKNNFFRMKKFKACFWVVGEANFLRKEYNEQSVETCKA